MPKKTPKDSKEKTLPRVLPEQKPIENRPMLPRREDPPKPIIPNGKKVNINGKDFCVNVQVRRDPYLSPLLTGRYNEIVNVFGRHNKINKRNDLEYENDVI